MYVLGINPTTAGTGTHDPSAAVFEDGELLFGAEEERFTREKHAERTFPESAIRASLEFCDIGLTDVETVSVAWQPRQMARTDIRLALRRPTLPSAYRIVQSLRNYRTARTRLENHLARIETPVPPIRTHVHHRCHAASAFYPSGFEKALVVTLDGRGERDATVVWRGDSDGLERLRTYSFPNSLGAFYSTVTAYLGYRPNNGEGKIMGLAPYGRRNQEIEHKLRQLVETGVDYDVTALEFHTDGAVGKLESLFDRPRRSTGGAFTDWEKDLAHVTQRLLEETVVDIVRTYCQDQQLSKVALAGGVALNCKMNKRVMELEEVERTFIQPVAHDAGGAVGAGWLEFDAGSVDPMSTVAWGPAYSTADAVRMLDTCKIPYSEPEDIYREVASRLADGELIGWMQGRLEMGPRALGNRSILADPRSTESRDRVNELVKHRERWRPFAPSMLETAAEEYLVDAEPAPYMIKTFDVVEHKREEIAAVLHPGDGTTRPQTVTERQNPRYHALISAFEDLTGVPVVLNTSFNDNGEPIVATPAEAVRDFFSMGLDTLVIEDLLVEKPVGSRVTVRAVN
jgi:carbamoyltransferase